MRALFEVEGKPCGEAEFEAFESQGKWREPNSHAFVCPVCASVWAKIIVEGKDYLVWRTNCPKHLSKSFYDPAGTLWMPLEVGVVDKMPRECLLREFQLHLENAERHGQLRTE